MECADVDVRGLTSADDGPHTVDTSPGDKAAPRQRIIGVYKGLAYTDGLVGSWQR